VSAEPVSGPLRACSLSDLADDTALRVELAGRPVCIERSGGEVFAISDVCSHADVSLSEGDVEDGHIECWLHGSMFDLRTGKPTGLPATEPVAVFAVEVRDDGVYVDTAATLNGVHPS
jgi:3-phenylpropionate/trans-cinnamate dioxygenase ferredoxin subunit